MKWLWAVLITSIIVIVAAGAVWLLMNADSSVNVEDSNNNNSEEQNSNIDEETESDETDNANETVTDTTADSNSTNSNTVPANSNTYTTGETGDNIDDFGACNDDAQTYCAGFYSADWEAYAAANGYRTASWKYGLVDCLEAHRDDTTQACDDSRDRREQLNENLVAACETDRGIYCRGVVPQPGSEPMVDCLEEHYSELSPECVVAFDAHAAAKPTE